jgi:DNA-binding NtrC family response regulator
MLIRERLEVLIVEMLNGQIMLDEARDEFEKLYIQKALSQNNNHLSKTANILGIHRNTLSKRVADYKAQDKAAKLASQRLSRTKTTKKKSNSRKK